MEPRFGHDFSGVRVHTDAKSAESARAVNAMAYTVGQDVVFASGQYVPQAGAGRWLLAHELAHVIQQQPAASGEPLDLGDPGDRSEHEADVMADAIDAGMAPQSPVATGLSRLARKAVPGKVHCTTGQQGAPADPVATLTDAESHAQGLAGAAAVLAEVGSAAATIDIDVTTTGVGQSYQARFGLPPAVRGGFMNRLTGNVVKTRNQAISQELELLSNRLQLIADGFDQEIHYKCIDRETAFMGCTCDCVDADACACGGIGAIFLCPGFWGLGDNMSTLLIHEAAHMIWLNVHHSGNYRDASCYANFVADILGAPLTGPDCPTPP
jgi:hypothetical protein